MARPKKSRQEQRSKIAKCRLTDEQDLSVRMNAAAAGLSLSEYFRRLLVGMTVTPPPARADAQFLAEANRIGVNLNQLALAENAGREFRGDWRVVRDELRWLLAETARRFL
jgi:hypothetical protein